MNNALKDIYYKSTNLWKGKVAVRKLAEAAGVTERQAHDWLSLQPFWQIHYPAPKKVVRPHYDITKPNYMHQFDILYMPSDRVYGTTYKYILTGVDVASRYKVARPLKTKKASETVEMIRDIYKVGPLRLPEVFRSDNGPEFKGVVKKWLVDSGVDVEQQTTKYNHTFTSFAESMNKNLAKRLFAVQDVEELKGMSTRDEMLSYLSTAWVKNMYAMVDKMNNEVTAATGLTPAEAIKLDKVKLVKQNYPEEEKLDMDGFYRYLLKPGEEHGDVRRRATDNIWSRDIYMINETISAEGERTLYKIEKFDFADPEREYEPMDRTFVYEELMQIPQDTNLKDYQ